MRAVMSLGGMTRQVVSSGQGGCPMLVIACPCCRGSGPLALGAAVELTIHLSNLHIKVGFVGRLGVFGPPFTSLAGNQLGYHQGRQPE